MNFKKKLNKVVCFVWSNNNNKVYLNTHIRRWNIIKKNIYINNLQSIDTFLFKMGERWSKWVRERDVCKRLNEKLKKETQGKIANNNNNSIFVREICYFYFILTSSSSFIFSYTFLLLSSSSSFTNNNKIHLILFNFFFYIFLVHWTSYFFFFLLFRILYSTLLLCKNTLCLVVRRMCMDSKRVEFRFFNNIVVQWKML